MWPTTPFTHGLTRVVVGEDFFIGGRADLSLASELGISGRGGGGGLQGKAGWGQVLTFSILKVFYKIKILRRLIKNKRKFFSFNSHKR